MPKLTSLAGGRGDWTNLPVCEGVKEDCLFNTAYPLNPTESLQWLLKVLVQFLIDTVQSPPLVLLVSGACLPLLPVLRNPWCGTLTSAKQMTEAT